MFPKIRPLIRRHFRESARKEFIPGKTKIPLSVPTYGAEEVEEALDSMLSTWVSMGKKVRQFEEAFADYLGSKHAVMVNSGSSANLLALSVLTNPLLKDRIRPGTEVITPAVTWVTTVYPIVNVGCKPVLVDVDLETFNVLPNEVERAIGPKTSAVLPVHLLGAPCQIGKVKRIASEHDLHLIEDACESTGAEVRGRRVGTFGEMGTFSFFMSHHISTIEGGMIVTNREDMYELLKSMRAFGWVRDLRNSKKFARENDGIDPRFLFVTSGFNLRPTEIQGAFGIHQIKKLDSFIEHRRRNAEYWNKRLKTYRDKVILPTDKPDFKHVFFGYPVTLRPETKVRRDRLVLHLENHGIATRPIMAGNFAEQPVMKQLACRVSGELTNSRIISQNSLFFGNHQGIGSEEREFIGDRFVEFLSSLPGR